MYVSSLTYISGTHVSHVNPAEFNLFPSGVHESIWILFPEMENTKNTMCMLANNLKHSHDVYILILLYVRVNNRQDENIANSNEGIPLYEYNIISVFACAYITRLFRP